MRSCTLSYSAIVVALCEKVVATISYYGMSEIPLTAAATTQVVAIAPKWHETYFEKVLKEVVDKDTGSKSMVFYSQCKLLESDNVTRCKSAYVYQPKYGTGNFSKHLRNKHGIDVSVKKSSVQPVQV